MHFPTQTGVSQGQILNMQIILSVQDVLSLREIFSYVCTCESCVLFHVDVNLSSEEK